MDLPPPAVDQAFCNVSVLEAGFVTLPLAWILDGIADAVRVRLPALSFLVRNSANADNFVFDLGIRKDWEKLPPVLIEQLQKVMRFDVDVPIDAVAALALGGVTPGEVTHILLSHLHMDHTGDTSLFSNAQVFAGAAVQPIVDNGYPGNPEGLVTSDVVPAGRTTYLDPVSWPALGPFPHAFDFYGNGSMYIVDAGNGHMPGHLNLLARTSADGAWVYLAGDTVHDWRIINGEGKMGHHSVFGCAHMNEAEAEAHIERVRVLMKENPRVQVLLAHDVPWYEKNVGGPAYFPGKLEPL
ncbi:Metallo-hydrolase/oxidoreductase [Epithele typhae]|uniref:Metallo-hydrolase/oxidoreductase n=1 Tax=Epithele typhae TaxID=378194 RepID=UPI002008C364|nr:Metallo-hydrolase/oxidoreductase [Epithele typhae]KAH9940440.1 Metallo-hydrolase/oxidoreductase [Epithele typhae]